MGRLDLRERIKDGVFLLDGAMGTQLMARKIEVGKCNDVLNIESPEIINEIQNSYSQAGSDAIITNTFGANKYALGRYGLADKVEELNKAGVEIARRAAGEEKYVLGDIGPSGDFLQPLGDLNPAELRDAFAVQAKSLLDAGADGFIIETMTAIEEAVIAVEAVKSVSADLPVFVSMAFDKAGEDFRTMMGVDVDSAVSKIVPLGVDAIGFNCGKMILRDYVGLAERFVLAVKALGKDVVILAEPNAGIPELIDDQAVYKVKGEEFAATAEKIHLAGVNILGGCCGTGPEHIEALAKKLKN